jgi:hypothetical protein
LLKQSHNFEENHESIVKDRKSALSKLQALRLKGDDSQLENSFDSRYKVSGGPLKNEYDKIRYKLAKKEQSPEGVAPLTKRFNPN